MKFTLQEIAQSCSGKLIGYPNTEITGVASLAEAGPGDMTFYGDPRYAAQLRRTRASAVFVPADFHDSIPIAQIRVANPSRAFEQVVLKLAPKPIQFAPGVHPTAVLDPGAKLGARVSVQPYAIIEAGAQIGDDTLIGAHSYIGHESVVGAHCKIYPRVIIRERTKIGSRVIIHSGAVVGADGFGFELVDGQQKKIPQLGFVQIDDDVEIGANTTVDRARFGRTWIQQGVKIDNLVQVAHNVVIGKNSAIAAQTGISGSTRIGENVMIAGQVGVNGHIEIGDGTMISPQSGIARTIGGGIWFGSPAVPLEDAKRQIAWIHRLGKLFARVKAIEEKLGL
ncbi:MAG TPA: UDP-3-O-(3-hydroxymyristoyl)glucosamine N-acyltransferase [Chthoniobacterales bacterium]|nr:UDP-3-O-(3-hydroxymyristoyl)glucosamine N-acyltransferase [Chthoniobacterales bacterium]